MVVLLYDMKLRIIWFDMMEPLPHILFFPMHFLVLRQKTEANLQILQWNPYLAYRLHKDSITFSAMESSSRLILDLCVSSFSLLKDGFCLNWFLFFCSFYARHFFFASRARTFNMNKTDSIVFRCSVYLFILPTNTVN